MRRLLIAIVMASALALAASPAVAAGGTAAPKLKGLVYTTKGQVGSQALYSLTVHLSTTTKDEVVKVKVSSHLTYPISFVGGPAGTHTFQATSGRLKAGSYKVTLSDQPRHGHASKSSSGTLVVGSDGYGSLKH